MLEKQSLIETPHSSKTIKEMEPISETLPSRDGGLGQNSKGQPQRAGEALRALQNAELPQVLDISQKKRSQEDRPHSKKNSETRWPHPRTLQTGRGGLAQTLRNPGPGRTLCGGRRTATRSDNSSWLLPPVPEHNQVPLRAVCRPPTSLA